MTRIIKASEVKPGMTIEWSQLGIKYTCVVSSIEPARSQISQEIMASGGGEATLYSDTVVTVLAEAQPEEPTPEVPERVDEWGTWDDVPEGVVVTAPGLFCHYRKNQGVVELSDPDDDHEWAKAGVRAMPREYGPWTRVTDA